MSSVLVVIVSKKITGPINKVAEACRNQSAGQLQKIHIKTTGDEVREVIHSLNFLIEKVSEHDRQNKEVLEKLSAKDAELEKAYQNLSRIDKSKDEFIAMVSHELKTPLTPMKIYLDMFRDSESLGSLNEGRAKAVNDGRVGLQEIKNGRFDLIILDIAMPEFSGLDIMKELKQSGLMDSLNIVISTASSVSDSERQAMISLGAKDILPKPFRVKELRAMIQCFAPH